MDLKNIQKKLVGDDTERAVSPVIGVILMVAITVILAAVIAAFVLDIGDLDEGAPQAQYEWDSNESNSEVSITHQSGDDIDLGQISVTVETDTSSGSSNFDSADFTAGDEITFEINGSDVTVSGASLDGDLNGIAGSEIVEVTLTWESDGTSSIIAEYEP